MPPVSTTTSTTRSRDPPEFRELDVHRNFNVTPFALTLYFELIFQVLPTVPCSPSFDFSRRPEISTAAEVPKAHMVPVAATRPRGLHPSRLVDSHGVLGGVELERRHVDTHVRPSHLRHADNFSCHREGPSTEASLMKASAHPSHRSSHRSDHRHVRCGTHS